MSRTLHVPAIVSIEVDDDDMITGIEVGVAYEGLFTGPASIAVTGAVATGADGGDLPASDAADMVEIVGNLPNWPGYRAGVRWLAI
jgi:hypothetical protein